ncbi:MAG: hypothetical protein ABW318_17810 [Vicinamibacterales bacterium]
MPLPARYGRCWLRVTGGSEYLVEGRLDDATALNRDYDLALLKDEVISLK